MNTTDDPSAFDIVPPDRPPFDLDVESLGTLRDYVSAARLRWPEIDINTVEFVRHIARHSRDVVLPIEHAGDLLLAYACLRGLPSAITAFHDSYGAVIRRVLSYRRTGPADAADITQMVYERLLVHRPGRLPRLASYRGRGPLRSWVAASVATTASTLCRADSRRRRREGSDPGSVTALMAFNGPELAYLKRLYRRDIGRAVEKALDSLDSRASILLRFHFGERLSVDQLGAMYGVNRATAARWVATARELLARAVQADICDRLRLSESDYRGLVELIRSELGEPLMKLFDRTNLRR